MTATYQNNFKKIKKYLIDPMPTLMSYDPKSYPFHDQKLIHESLHHSFDPWKALYSSKIPHINLFEINILKQIETLPLFLVKDGLFTLLDFFNRFSNSKEIPGIMLVHSCLKDFIPNNWRAKVGFYEIEYRNQASPHFQQKNKHILIKANVTDSIFDYELAKKKVLELKKKKFEKFTFFFFNRTDPLLTVEWDLDERTNIYVASQNNFLKFLESEKIDYEFLTWKEYFHAQSMHQYHCLDLNYKEKYYIDDFANYLFAKKGATPAELISQKGNDEDIFFPISSFHGVRILANEPEYNDNKANEIQRNLKLMRLDKVKFNISAFQMVDNIAGKKLESAWFKNFI